MRPAALFWKEVRQLLPWTVLVVALQIGFQLLKLLFKAPDQISWAEHSPIFHGGSATDRNFTLLVSALVFAYSGFPREYDDRTLPFLLSLPVSRTHVFLSKALAAGTLLTAIVLGEELTLWLLQLANPTSYGHRQFRPEWALVSAGSGVVLAWIFLGYGFFLSLFRRFGLLLGLLALATIAWLVDERPAFRRANPFDLQRMGFKGARVLVPWAAFAAHLAVAAALSSAAAFVWVGRLDRVSAITSKLAAKPWVKGAFGAVLAACFGTFFWWSTKHFEEAKGGFGTLLESESPEARITTRRYEFRFPEALRPRVEALASSADAMHDHISTELGAPESSRSVVVNLLRSSPTHAGSATWETIRMDVFQTSDEKVLSRVLAHESAHVIGLRASNRGTTSHGESLRFFDEGLAEYVALGRVPDENQLAARRFQAALLRARHRVDFSDLVSFPRFNERFGEAAIYGPGLLWVEAFIAVCGAEGTKRVLALLGKDDMPRDVAGEALWQHLLQAQRCELSRVNARWNERLTSLTTELQAEIARVPTLRGAPAFRDEELVFDAEIDGERAEDAVYQLLLRNENSDGKDALSASSADPASDGRLTFHTYEPREPGDTVEFQFVVTWLREGVPVSFATEWQKSALPAVHQGR